VFYISRFLVAMINPPLKLKARLLESYSKMRGSVARCRFSQAQIHYLCIDSTISLAPASTACATSSTGITLTNNTFIYSPTSERYAAGMLNNQFGSYIAYGYANVTSTSIWTASQSSTSYTAYFAG
jgi:hypothetical protein